MQAYKIHLPKHQMSPRNAEASGFYGTLYRGLRDAGCEVEFCQRTSVTSGPDFGPEAFHFVHQGIVRQPNALNTGPSYLRQFWYADPRGVLSESSISQKAFDPMQINPKWAAGFARRMRKRFIDNRRSKYPQPKHSQNFGQGHIAVFLQGESIPMRRALLMEEVDMVKALLAGIPDRKILVKPHPRNDDVITLAQIMQLAQDHKRLRIVDANVHDLLAGAAMSCSVSSSVSIEGMLHHVPAMLFGQTDFHHCAVTVEDAADVAYAYDMALKKEWPFEQFLYWFFRENCLDERREDWFDILMERVNKNH